MNKIETNHFFVNKLENQEIIGVKENAVLEMIEKLSLDLELEVICLYVKGNNPPIYSNKKMKKKIRKVSVPYNINHSTLLKMRNEISGKICLISGNGFDSDLLLKLNEKNDIKYSFLICYVANCDKFTEWINHTEAKEITTKQNTSKPFPN